MPRSRIVALCLLAFCFMPLPRARAESVSSRPDPAGSTHELVQFLADEKVSQAFLDAARADKSGDHKAWLRATKHPGTYLGEHGVKLDTSWSVRFETVTDANTVPLHRLYCIKVRKCFGPSPNGPKGCYTVTECVPANSL
jgi:hypothetical protein